MAGAAAAAQWAWGNDNAGFVPMDDASSAVLEAALQALSFNNGGGAPQQQQQQARVTYDVNQGHRVARYEVDLLQMTQTNVATGFVRAVRRFPGIGAPAPAGTWLWETDDGGWYPLESDTAAFLDLLRSKGAAAARFWTDSRTQYEADGLQSPNGSGMRQRNLATNRARRLRVQQGNGPGAPQTEVVDAAGVLARCRDVSADATAKAAAATAAGGQPDDCNICLEHLANAQSKGPTVEMPACPHLFHRACIQKWLQRALTCPVCSRSYGPTIGDMPPGSMQVHAYPPGRLPLAGHEREGTIVLTYSFRGGIQGPKHQNPGAHYGGTTRTCFLPDTPEGRELLELLRRAWAQKLMFTIGHSITRGQDNCIVWNGIHMKTSPSGGPTQYGYPDPGYFQRLRDELRAKGIQ